MIVDIEDFLTDEVVESLKDKLTAGYTIIVNGDTLVFNGENWEMVENGNQNKPTS